MSLIIQSLNAGNLAPAGGAAAGTSGAANTSAGFANTLVQTMTGADSAKGTEASVNSNLASLLQGLLGMVQGKGEESGAADMQKADLLKGLVQDMEKLDESLEADPALLAALQGWLLQVSALLSGRTSMGQADVTGNAAEELSPLARNPETLRFAVQDELNSLALLIQNAADGGNEETAAKGTALLNQFSAILSESKPADNKYKLEGNGNEAARSRTQRDGTAKNEILAVTGVTVTADEESELTGTVTAAAMSKMDAAEEALPAAKVTLQEHEVVTAGQLSLRNGITVPLKAESAPVPVQQFAQEMNTFIGGKLEIIQKGGVAEASITLFPENLGQVDVKITMQNGNLIAQFVTQHTGAKDMLEQQMSQLRLALQSQGLQVERLEVTQNNASSQSQWTGQQGQQAGAGAQQQGRRSRERQEESSDAVLAAELNGEWKDLVSASQQDSQNGGFSAKI